MEQFLEHKYGAVSGAPNSRTRGGNAQNGSLAEGRELSIDEAADAAVLVT
jgi:hypothetical protein